ncbi:MAG: hypothetical protein WDM77_07135 [Steroidobacteraceae bacterium]
MNATLEPREVERPFRKRWLRMTWQLFVRSPIRFGILIALLGWIDTTAVNLAYGFVVPRVWVDRVGMLCLPLLWVIVSAVARGADDHRQTWTALHELTRWRLWSKALMPGAVLIACSIVIFFVLQILFDFPAPAHPLAYSQKPGALLQTVAAQSFILSVAFGICYAPLLVFWPQLSFKETEKLSRSASALNNRSQINWLIIALLGVGLPLELVPTYGMGEAALLVFMGALNYVAYRDIVERRDENLPAKAPETAVPTTATATVDIMQARS